VPRCTQCCLSSCIWGVQRLRFSIWVEPGHCRGFCSPPFFFSSRRRHTISKRDWSSDVCSSDLPQLVGVKQFYDHNDERYLVFIYIAEQFSGTVKESDEGKLTWMSAKELKKQKLAYNFDHDLPVFFEQTISEHMLDGKRDELF